MQEIADAGAKVLHNRCIQMGKKFNCNIVSKSTFSDTGGTRICQRIETSEIKSIVKNEKLVVVEMRKRQPIKQEEVYDVYESLLQNNIIVEAFQKEETQLQFRMNKVQQNKVQELLEKRYSVYDIKQKDVVKLSIIGFGIIQDSQVLNQVMEILRKYQIEILNINLTQAKIEILVKEIENEAIEKLHGKLIKN